MPTRSSVGWLAAALLAAGAAIALFESWDNVWCGPCIRTGVVLAGFWLAMPTRTRPAAWARVSPWLLVGLIVGLLLVARRPYVMIPLLAAAGAIGLVLRWPLRSGARGDRSDGPKFTRWTPSSPAKPADSTPPRLAFPPSVADHSGDEDGASPPPR